MRKDNYLKIEKEIYKSITSKDKYLKYYYPYIEPDYLNTDEKVDEYIEKIISFTKQSGYSMVVYRNDFALKDKNGYINSEYKGIIYNNCILFLLYLGNTRFNIQYGFEINLDLNKEIKKLVVEKEI